MRAKGFNNTGTQQPELLPRTSNQTESRNNRVQWGATGNVRATGSKAEDKFNTTGQNKPERMHSASHQANSRRFTHQTWWQWRRLGLWHTSGCLAAKIITDLGICEWQRPTYVPATYEQSTCGKLG